MNINYFNLIAITVYVGITLLIYKILRQSLFEGDDAIGEKFVQMILSGLLSTVMFSVFMVLISLIIQT